MSVSVCLLTYNRADRLPATLDSILAQSMQNFELIISDDCSTDATEDICKSYALRDTRIHYLRQKTNLNMPGNLNMALKNATREYVAIMHDGDIYHPQVLSQWQNALDTYPSAAFVFNAYRTVRNGQEVIYREPYPELIRGEILGSRLLRRWDSCVYGTVMARRERIAQIGGFDPRFGNLSDVDMWLRLAKDYDVAYINDVLIDLMPRDPTRFYGFVHWKVVFWIMGIHVLNLQRYKTKLPRLVASLEKQFRLRRSIYFLYMMALCIKHHRWDRTKEGLAVWRDADDFILRAIGYVLGKQEWRPEWYDQSLYWSMASITR